jgi:kynurenine formamidase
MRALERFLLSFGLAALLGLTMQSALHAQEQWYPSRYGADDEIGAANNLSPEGVLKAVKLVKEGKVYALGVESGPATPIGPGRRFGILIMQQGAPRNSANKNKVTVNDDLLISSLGVGTQLDGFAHIGIDYRHYNGVPIEKIFDPKGVRKYGTEKIPPIVTRGILLDIAALKGVPRLKGGTAIGRAEIEAAMARQGVTIDRGDVVILHTGWLGLVAEGDTQSFMMSAPGLNVDGAQYLADLGVVAVGTDTAAVEVIPFEDKDRPLPVHQTLLTKNGVYILEIVNTSALAADKVSEFLFVLGQPRFVGAVQMVVNPIAIR